MASGENFSGNLGGDFLSLPMAKMAAIGFMSAHGGFLVAISNMVQPTLQISDFLP